MNIGCIYMITNTINGKKYIGQTWDFKRRKSEHRPGGNKHPIAKAFAEYGKEAFSWAVLKYGINNQIELDKAEAQFILRYDTIEPMGYNVLAGGNKSKRTKIFLQKQKAGILRVTQTPEWRRKNLAQLRRMHASPEWRRKHDAAMARNPQNPEWKKKHAEMVERMKKPVCCIENNQIFSSTKNAEHLTAIDSSSISKVCRGLRKIAGGLHWQYVN